MKHSLLVCVLAGSLAVSAGAQPRKYGASVAAIDKAVNFSALTSYVWTSSQPAPDKTVDAQIVAAVDRELAALGMTKRAAEPGDVLVTYASQQRTDVDVKAKKGDTASRPEHPVGVLLVSFLEPGSHRRLLSLRLDTPIDAERAKLQEAIDAGVAALFTKYPRTQPR